MEAMCPCKESVKTPSEREKQVLRRVGETAQDTFLRFIATNLLHAAQEDGDSGMRLGRAAGPLLLLLPLLQGAAEECQAT